MRHPNLWLLSALALATISCTGRSDSPLAGTTAPPSTSPAQLGLGTAVVSGDAMQSALAIYTVTLDPGALAATIALKETRSGQANDDVYALSINNFLNASSVKIAGITGTATSVDVDYIVTHPFPAPSNPSGAPNGSTNRSDLAISGMVLTLADVASATGNTYFTDRVANTELVANADGYFSPAGLITSTATANTFPYKLLVDESGPDGSRLGISNGGDPTGNYGADGWTFAEYGGSNDGWTGYGVLHQGQASTNTLSLDRDALIAAGSFSFDLAVIAQYNDPRGGANATAKRANRLPPATPDHTRFAYRMPHGALDVQRVVFEGEGGGFIENTISASELRFHVEDWDVLSAETAAADLSEDATVTNVAVGESGAPSLSVCIPGVLGDATVSIDLVAGPVADDSGYGGDAGADAGLPGDALFYAELVTKGASTGQVPGEHTGLIRVSDITAGAPLWIPLDESTPPGPLASNLPVPVTYQAFTVDMAPDNIDPTGDWSIATNPIFDGGTTSINVSNVIDPDSATFDIQVDWNDGNGFVTEVSGLTPGAGPFNSGASPVYTLTVPTTPETRTLAVRLVDGVSGNTPLATNVGGDILNIDPAPAGYPGWVYTTANTATGGDQSFHIAVDSTGAAYISGWFTSGGVDFGGGLRTNSGGGTVYYICKVDNTGAYLWDRMIDTNVGGTATGFAATCGLAVDSSNNVYTCGYYRGTLNLGGVPLLNNQTTSSSYNDLFIVKYNSAGTHQWQISSTGNGTMNSSFGSDSAIDVNSAGEVVACFDFDLTETFGAFSITPTGGGASTENDPGVVKLDATGTPVWLKRIVNSASTTTELARAALIDDTGAVYVGGQVRSGADFGGGAWTTVGVADGFLVKLDPAGNYVWAKQVNGTSSDDVWGLARDASNVYMAGQFYTGADFGGGTRTAGGTGADAFIAAYTQAGTYLWDTVFTGSANTDYAFAVAAGGGSVMATGFYYVTTDFVEAGPKTALGSSDIWVASFNPANGDVDWVNSFGGTGLDDGRDVAVDANGDPYFTGRWASPATVDWDPGAGVASRTNSGGNDIVANHWLKASNSF